MARYFFMFVLQAIVTAAAMAQETLTLEVEGRPYGAFTSLNRDREGAGTVTLTEGWVSPAFTGLWCPNLNVETGPGSYSFPTDIIHNARNVTERPCQLVWAISPVTIPKDVVVSHWATNTTPQAETG